MERRDVREYLKHGSADNARDYILERKGSNRHERYHLARVTAVAYTLKYKKTGNVADLENARHMLDYAMLLRALDMLSFSYVDPGHVKAKDLCNEWANIVVDEPDTFLEHKYIRPTAELLLSEERRVNRKARYVIKDHRTCRWMVKDRKVC